HVSNHEESTLSPNLSSTSTISNNDKPSSSIYSEEGTTISSTDQSPNSKINSKMISGVNSGGDIEKASIGDVDTPPAYLKGLELSLVMIGLGLGVFLSALDQTIVATALPQIASDFNALNQIAWACSN
ncbi:10698_t:CDS:2, partial [Ambispora gerdemannii]